MPSGIVNLLKPPGMTSRQAVSRVGRLTGEKAGHAGTLDPAACGVLPVLLGRATRLFDFVGGGHKQYLAEICFGAETDTQDAAGRAVRAGGRVPGAGELAAVLPRFAGDIVQTPPAYSARKVDGVRAYRLARGGERPRLAAHTVTVQDIRYAGATARDRHLIRVVCGRGTYIRTLCEDIGRALGTFAHMSFLMREAVGAFVIDRALTPEALERAVAKGLPRDAWLTPVDAVLSGVPEFRVLPAWEKPCLNGVPLPLDAGAPRPRAAGETLRITCAGALVGLGVVGEREVRINTWLMDREGA